MGKYPPLYRYSLKEAVAWQEKDKWRKSYEENVACAKGIQKAIHAQKRDCGNTQRRTCSRLGKVEGGRAVEQSIDDGRNVKST